MAVDVECFCTRVWMNNYTTGASGNVTSSKKDGGTPFPSKRYLFGLTVLGISHKTMLANSGPVFSSFSHLSDFHLGMGNNSYEKWMQVIGCRLRRIETNEIVQQITWNETSRFEAGTNFPTGPEFHLAKKCPSSSISFSTFLDNQSYILCKWQRHCQSSHQQNYESHNWKRQRCAVL